MPCVYSVEYFVNQAVQALPKQKTHLTKLVDPRLHQLGLHGLVLAPALRVHVLLQVHRQELEYQIQFGLLALMVKKRKRPPEKHLHQNILQVYYVGVL